MKHVEYMDEREGDSNMREEKKTLSSME